MNGRSFEYGNDLIGDNAGETLRSAQTIVEDAIRTWQRRTAPPAIPQTVRVDVDGQEGETEEVTLTRKPPVAAITAADRREWLQLILQAVAVASAARAQADALALQSVSQ